MRIPLSPTCVLALTFLVLNAAPSAAGPPYAVDDPGTLEYRGTFLYLWETGVLSRGRYTSTFPSVALAYGFSPQLELSVGAAGLPESSPSFEFQDPFVSLKWRFVEETERSPGVAIAYQGSFITQDAGLGTGFFTHAAWLTAGKSLWGGNLYGNLGVVVPERGSEHLLFYGIAYERPVGSRLVVGAQLHGFTEAQRVGIPEDLAWGIGATYQLNPRLQALFQGGRSFRGKHDFNVYAGVLVQVGR